MNRNERYALISEGRGGELRTLAHNMINDADQLPTKTELKAALAEIYPEPENEKLRGTLLAKLTELATHAQDRSLRFDLRGIADELVIKVETELVHDDSLVPVPKAEEIDAAAIADANDKFSDRIGGDREREQAKAMEAARETLRQAGVIQ